MENWTRSLRSIYRREPVIGFMVTAGAVNVALGSFTEHWTLMSVGLSVVGLAIALGVRQMQTRRRPSESRNRSPMYVLPPAASLSLPMLSVAKKDPPGR
ncbi:MAG: hypothetical protein NW224_18480 [Leptolyngbyaceae cyanobacterium bins.302]|nr:hypothetical protein [Leptolyngbyaceae cyanobacterium bins.302]